MKYTVETFGGETFEVDADEVEVDPMNSNRVTFKKSGKVVGQHNEVKSAMPKSASK